MPELQTQDWIKPFANVPTDKPVFALFPSDDQRGMQIRLLKFTDGKWQQDDPNTGQLSDASGMLGWKPFNGQPGGGPPSDWSHEKVADWVARMWTPGYDMTHLNAIDGMTMCGLALMTCAEIINKEGPDAILPNAD